jgi:hypothetical protein
MLNCVLNFFNVHIIMWTPLAIASQILTGFGSGYTLSDTFSKEKTVGAFFAVLLLGFFTSLDIFGRSCIPHPYVLSMVLAIVMALVLVVPWATSKDDATRRKRLQIIAPCLALLVLLVGVVAGSKGIAAVGTTPACPAAGGTAGLQGAIMTLMYVAVSASIGSAAADIKKPKMAAAAKGRMMIMGGLLTLLILFDGASMYREDIAAKANAAANAAAANAAKAEAATVTFLASPTSK